MSQTKAQLIDPVDGTIVNADINASAAIAGSKISPDFGSQNITTTGIVKIADGSVSAPALAFTDDLDTGIFSVSQNTINFTTAGVERLEMGTSLTVFNEDGADVDFRIEGDTLANLFYVNAGTDRVGINTDTPLGHLGVAAAAGTSGTTASAGYDEFVIEGGNEAIGMCFLSPAANNCTQRIAFGDSNNNKSGLIAYEHGNDAFAFDTGGSERMRLDSSGRLLIGTTTVGDANADDLTVAGSGHSGITIRSGTSNTSQILFTDSTSGTGSYIGVVAYRHASDSMGLFTNATERLTIDSSGHMGLGVTPDDSWPTNADFRALQIGTGACVFGRGSGDEDRGGITVNYYHTGSAEKYLANGNASGMLLNDGDIDFFVAAANSSGVDAAMSKTIAMRIAADSDIGIGTLDPATAMHIAKTDDPVTITLQNTDSNTPTDSGGEIIFKGTQGGGAKFFGGIGGRRRNQASDVTGYLAFYRQDGDGSNNAIEAGRIDHGGHVYFTGMTGLTASSTVKGVAFENSSTFGRLNIHATSSAGTAPGVLFYHSGNNVGGINYTSSSVIYNTSSDYRLKENVIAISDGITRLKTLKPYRFNFKADPSKTVDGFFAHEVTAVPEAITGTKDEVETEDNEEKGIKKGDPIYQGIDQSKLVPLLVAAVQELITKVETLEAA